MSAALCCDFLARYVLPDQSACRSAQSRKGGRPYRLVIRGWPPVVHDRWQQLRGGATALVWDGGLFDHLSGGVGLTGVLAVMGVRKPVDQRMSWRRRRTIRWPGCGSAQRSSTCRSSPRCAGFATVRDGSIPLPGKAEWSLLMVEAGERVRRCAYRRGQNEPHRGEAGMPERGCCGLPGSATAEPDLVLPGLRWR